jgi:TetR/AcrR family transcriptional regulator, transcriptional repressor for nem operon
MHNNRTMMSAEENKALVLEAFGAQLQSNDAGTRRRCAIGIFAVMMGTLQLARAEPNPTRSRQILKSGIDTALVLGRSLQITPESRRPTSAKEKPGRGPGWET